MGAIESSPIGSLAANHRFAIVAGVREDECRELVVDFFRGKREKPAW